MLYKPSVPCRLTRYEVNSAAKQCLVNEAIPELKHHWKSKFDRGVLKLKSSMFLYAEPDVKPLLGLGGDFEKNAELIAELGFDGLELITTGHPNQIDIPRIKKIADRYQLSIPNVAAGLYFVQNGLSLCTNDSSLRKKTIYIVNESLRVAAELNSNFTVGLHQGKVERSYEESFSYLKDSLQQCAKVAEEQGVLIFVEAMNRYLPAMIRTISDGKNIIDAVASTSLKILTDTHHMNIEERSLADSIRQAKGYLAHMHFSDNNRLAPGQGHIDYYKIAEALKDIGYEGYVSAEILPEPDPLTAARQTIELIKSLPY